MRLKEWVYDSIGWLFCELAFKTDMRGTEWANREAAVLGCLNDCEHAPAPSAPSDALVERVARAVWEEMDCPQPCERLEGCSCATDAARAALAAIGADEGRG